MEVYSFFLIVKDMVLLLFPSSEYKLAFLFSFVLSSAVVFDGIFVDC